MHTTGAPAVSIITVVYNGAARLETTILSVLNQQYANLEYIIIDGGSTDGTIDIIRKYQDRIAYWVSEKDHGIYDAMNKAIAVAKGEWINFMNCGDSFTPNIIAKIFTADHHGVDIIYGDAIIQYPTFDTLYRKIPLTDMWKGMPFCHQSAFVRISLMRKYKFDLAYKLCADFDFLMRAYKNGSVFKYIDDVVCFFDFKEGASVNNVVRSVGERRHSALRHCPGFKIRAYYFFHLVYIRTGVRVKQFIGEKPTAWITRLLRT